MARKFEPLEVEFVFDFRQEDIPIEGNAIASGNEKVDKEYEEQIRRDLEGGNDWAWCTVIMEARWAGFTGRDTLGGCSYKDAQDFRQKDGYFEDMLHACVRDLIRQIKDAGWELKVDKRDIVKAARHGFDTAILLGGNVL